MVYAFCATTDEIDDVTVAVEEILRQLDLEANLRRNAVGIVGCYSEFVDTGVYQAVCRALPFPVVGATTYGSAAAGGTGQLLMNITLLTSDDVEFSCALSAELTQGCREHLDEVYATALRGLGEEPAFGFVYAPLIFNIGGDVMLEALDRTSNGLPFFGTVALDHTADYHTAATLYNGKAYPACLALVLVAGSIRPEFFVGTLSAEKIVGQEAVITASEGNLLKEVNGISILQHFESLGFYQGGELSGINVLPFMVDFGDGTPPVVRAVYSLTGEGYAVCGGGMPQNAMLSVSMLEFKDIMDNTAAMVEKLLRSGKKDAALIYSCIGRFFVLDTNPLAELELVDGAMAEEMPYSMCYSGGEICPVRGEDGRVVNRFHNDSIVAIAF